MNIKVTAPEGNSIDVTVSPKVLVGELYEYMTKTGILKEKTWYLGVNMTRDCCPLHPDKSFRDNGIKNKDSILLYRPHITHDPI